MYGCPDVMKLMHAFLDGELDATETGRVQAHLQECMYCRDAFASERSFLKLLKSHTPEISAPTRPQTDSRLAALSRRSKVRSLQIRTFGCCAFTLDGRPIPDDAWHGPHTKRLLLILVSFGRGSLVPRDELIDLLRASGEPDPEPVDFYRVLHQLQAVLGRPCDSGSVFIRLQRGRFLLDPEYCAVDCWRFEETVSSAKRYAAYGQGEETRRFLTEARALYRGPFLPAIRERWAELKRYGLERQIVWIESRADRAPDRE
ncbi:MAG: zf-HC2 domain-containing protein [Nitrospirota bacterium]